MIHGANDRIRLGVIGVNGRGRGISSCLAKLPECEVVCICDVDTLAMESCIGLGKEAMSRGDCKTALKFFEESTTYPENLQADKKHIGIRNIRDRLAVMVGGKLEIESTPGAGTKVRITIPKEGKK